MINTEAKTVDWIAFQKEIQAITFDINNKLHEKAFSDDSYVRNYISFDYPAFIGNEVIKLAVNWSCIGSTSYEKTKAFAEALTEAAEIAEHFHLNGYKVTFD